MKTATPASAEFTDKNLGRRLVRNTVAVVVGANLSSLGRLVAAALVVRSLGPTVFGEYALIVVWLTIAEWILDFGTTEVFIREANQVPEQRDRLIRILLAQKAIQAPAAVLVLLIGMVAMQYSERVIMAGMVASISLFFVAGVTVCRPVFKAALKMEREIAADFASVIALLCLVPTVAHLGWGLMGLMAAYAASRGVFLVACLLLSRGIVRFSIRGVALRDVWNGIEASAAIGIIGFVAVAYGAADLLVLSRTSGLSDLAVYSAAQRFTTPVVTALNAIAVSVYPALALQKSPDKFKLTCQRAVDAVVQLGALPVVCVWCGAEFFMSLLSRDFAYGAGALRVLAVACIVRALSMVMGPVLYLVRAQKYALGYMAVALAVKIAVLAMMARVWGYMGAAVATLAVEAVFLLPITLYFVYSLTGFAVRYLQILRVAAAAVAVVAVTRMILPGGSAAAAATASLLYVGVVLGLRIVRTSDVRMLLRRESA